MAIIYDKKKQVFYLHTQNTSYIFGIFKNKELIHIHYGKKIVDVPCAEYFEKGARGFMPQRMIEGELYSAESQKLEYSNYGSPDLRTPSFHAQYPDGSSITDWSYVGHRIYKGKDKLQGLPATYAEENDNVESLEIELEDKLTGLHFYLQYSVFYDFDAITRSVRIKNCGKDFADIKSVMSTCVDFDGTDFDFYSLKGAWARERHLSKVPVNNGFCGIDSKRGSSSHMFNPFVILASENATENTGDAYGFSLVYSGNFIAEAIADQNDVTRVIMGINPFDFSWRLDSGEEFQSPEAVMVYSANGFGDMSRNYHKLYAKRLVRGKYRDAKRPVLLNNWEATYFDFDEDKIVNIAKKAKECGVELMVLDDGWFGKRNDDTTSLGDWFVNCDKLPGGVDGLAKKINDLGMKFGIWVEPEMVSEKSKLYEAHPDWCLQVRNREKSVGRNQYILDYSRDDVCEYIIDILSELFKNASISYVKWDMNRNMSEIGSLALSAEHQRETAHRYMLGLYSVLETLTSKFPDILFEGCSGGGGRFDPGMLYYFPQIWTSDDSDAVERLYIQEGTSMVYPFSAMGAHVSAVPNHQVGRVTDIDMRGDVAKPGQFGYELDLATLTEDEIEKVKEQIKFYKKYDEVFHKGDVYRLKSAFSSNVVAWEFISEDKETVILCLYRVLKRPEEKSSYVKFKGLDDTALYSDGEREFSGGFLSNVGLDALRILSENADFKSKIVVFKRK